MEQIPQAGGVVSGRLRRWLSAFAGMGAFGLIWLGHVVTLVGTSILRFAFIVQTWLDGQRATQVILLTLFALLPRLLLSPITGALVDRINQRTALMLADVGGLIVLSGLVAVHFSGDLQLWHIYLAVALAGCAEAFEYPAFSSATPLLVDNHQLARANGLLAAAKSAADIGGPALGGVLVAVSSLGAILMIDLASFVFALVTIWLVRIPRGSPARAVQDVRPRLLDDAVAGLRYLLVRPSFRGLLLVICTVNLVVAFGFFVLQPMVLARTGNDSAALASVTVALGVGGVAGGALMAAWGGPRDRVRGLMLGIIGMCVAAQIVVAAVRAVPAWVVAALVGTALLAIVNSLEQTILQTKVPERMRGRIFGSFQFISQLSLPVSVAAAGPLADHLFEPQARSGTGVIGLFGGLLGHGPGSGMAVMLGLSGVLGVAAALFGLANRAVRDIDVLIPDIEGRGGDNQPGVGSVRS